MIDEDGDGEITLQEFVKWWESDYAVDLRGQHDEVHNQPACPLANWLSRQCCC